MRATDRRSAPRTRRRAHTLLELLMASSLMAVTLVPALVLFRDSMQVSHKLEVRELLTTLCASKLEEHLALAAADANWQPLSASGNFSAQGYASLKFQVQRTDTSSELTGGGGLMSVIVTVWDDSDGDNLLDTGEPWTVLASKVAQMASYQDGT